MSHRTEPSDTSKMPTGIPYIIGNEAAERFSFYGMKTILVVFIAQYLHLMGSEVTDAYSKNEASDMVYMFNIAVYLTPVLGAIIADLWWGKYKTIMYLSVVYCLGHLALAFMGIAGGASTWLLLGLMLIALGAGGIKPCVSAHVGDQFGPNNQNRLSTVFNWFYFSINLGAVVATLLIPYLLEHFGPHIAFGVPGVLMALATFVFWTGRGKFIHVPAPGRKFVTEIFSGKGVMTLLKLSSIFIFIPIFWALFDQTATTWIHQSQDMDREVFGFTLSPSQIQFVNPFLILVLIPLFTYVIYPFLARFTNLTALKKMNIGLFITALAFGVSAYIQTMIEGGQTPHVTWQFVAYLLITSAEIMVSIVCLEFAYTQSPKSMKSAIMSIFLVTVALGNFINLGINKIIYSPSPHKNEIALYHEKKKTDADAKYIQILDSDKNPVINVLFNSNGTVQRREIPSQTQLNTAAVLIQDWTNKNNKLPLSSTGQDIIQGNTDQWGHQIEYKLINGSEARVRSKGIDQLDKTQWDSILTLKFSSPLIRAEKAEEAELKKEALAKGEKPKKSWLEKRMKKLNYSDTNNEGEKNPDQRENFTLTYSCGNIAKVEGANHFWLFTGIMFLAALVFIPVARLYAKTYKPEQPDTLEDEPHIDAHQL